LTEVYVPGAHQRIGTQFLIDHKRCMLVADPGLGKTAMALSAIDLLLMAGSRFFPALVIAPKRVADVVWTKEQRKWDAFQGLRVVQIRGSAAERMAIIARLTADIYVINYELVPWLIKQLAGVWPFKIVIADESSKLKGFRLNKGGVRADALSNIAKFTQRWWNLTGTPCPNGLLDVWGQMWFVDYGERLKRTYGDYSDAFFIQDQYTQKWSMQFGAEAEIHRLLADVMIALRAEDWLDLKVPQVIPMEFELPPGALAHYRQMQRDYFTELGEIGIEAPTAAAKSTKLLQLAAGSVYDEFEQDHPVHEARLEALADVLEETGNEPVLISYWWRFDVPRILKEFPFIRVYDGLKDEDDFNAGKIKGMLLHQQASYGISLHERCRDMCFYSYVWNAEHRTQMIARVGAERQAQLGKKCVVRIWDITAADTMDQDVLDSNAGKISIEQALKRARARIG
jgi:hypothetical protein